MTNFKVNGGILFMLVLSQIGITIWYAESSCNGFPWNEVTLFKMKIKIVYKQINVYHTVLILENKCGREALNSRSGLNGPPANKTPVLVDSSAENYVFAFAGANWGYELQLGQTRILFDSNHPGTG